MLSAESVSLRAGDRQLLQDISLQLRPGELHVLLGANGAGKSSLLRLLAGELKPQHGKLWLNQRLLLDWSPRERARQRAVLPQGESLRFSFTAAEVVGLGRLAAHTGSPEQEAALVAEAMRDTDVLHLATRTYPSLSGGERQRVQLARVLVQLATPDSADLRQRYLLLDEPIAGLDLAHQHSCLALARRKARQGAGVLAVLHDLHLAARIADRVSLLHQGRLLAQGEPSEILTPELLRTAFGNSLQFHRRDSGGRPWFEVGGPLDELAE